MIKKFIITKKIANEDIVFQEIQHGEDLGFAGIRESFVLYNTAEEAQSKLKEIEKNRADLVGIFGVFEIHFKSELIS